MHAQADKVSSGGQKEAVLARSPPVTTPAFFGVGGEGSFGIPQSHCSVYRGT